MKDLISRSCIRKIFSVSSKASSFSCERKCLKEGNAGLQHLPESKTWGLLPTNWTTEMGGSDPKLILPCWPGPELLIGEGVMGDSRYHRSSTIGCKCTRQLMACYLGCKACEMLEVAAHTVGFLNDRVEVELGDLLHEAILIAFPVL